MPGLAAPETPPLVFVGPSMPADLVRRYLPSAELRPPVRRGDLHLARMLRYSVFVVLDGVFAQDEAISPREVVDVVQDGAVFVGGASMGALRAVDCAPAGAIGAGRIYRLFRRGILDSEDEVAVAFDPDTPFPAVSQPLAGIRLALRRAVRQGRLKPRQGQAAFAAAQGLRYPDRTWPAILANLPGPSPDADLQDWLVRQDIKQEDARCVLDLVARRIASDPDWALRPRRSRAPFADPQAKRSRRLPVSREEWRDTAGALLWLLASGRANRFLDPPETALGVLTRLAPSLPQDWTGRLQRLNWDEAFAGNTDEAKRIAGLLVDRMGHSGDSEAEFFRFAAVAGVSASCDKLASGSRERRIAEVQLAIAHRQPDWETLLTSTPEETRGMILRLAQYWARAKTASGNGMDGRGRQ